MHMRVLAVIAVSLLLAGCGCEQAQTDDTVGSITEFSFRAAHYDEDCGAKRGCRDVFTPDTWWLRVCTDGSSKDCRDMRITHAPWDWQIKGAPVLIHWQTYCSGGWYVASIDKRS